MNAIPCVTRRRSALALAALLAGAASPPASQAQTTPASDAGAPPQRVEITGNATPAPYVVRRSGSGTKTDTPLLDTPMAVQVVPREVIDDRQERTSIDVVKNVSGVQSSTYVFYDQFLIRGFDSGYGSTFRNGLQLQGITGAVDMAFVDRIEVVKGPSSMLYGRIEPGGFVNVVTKIPQAAPARSVELQAGRWGFARATADLTGPLTGDGQWQYRVMGALDRSDSWVRNAHREARAAAATLAWKPSARFDASLQLELYDRKATWQDAGVPVIGSRPAPVPRDFSILYPQSWSDYPYNAQRALFAFEWSYALNDAWKLTQRFHRSRSDEDQQGVYANDFDGVDSFASVRFTHSAPKWIRTAVGTNLDLTGNLRTGEIEHKLLIGADASRFVDDTPGSTGNVAGAPALNIFNPAYTVDAAALRALAAADASNILWRDRSRDAGLYVQDQMSFSNPWSLLVGGRWDRAQDAYSADYGNRGAACYPHCTGLPISPYPADSAFSPRAGLLYKLSDSASVYASYARSFGAANGRDADGNPLKPQIGTQFELGAKASLLDGRLTASATLFDLTKTNITQYDPVNFFPHVVGKARSRGLELDAAGQLTPNLSVIGSYTWDQARITRDPYGGTEGHRLSGVAPHVASLWAKLDSAPGAAQGWAFGAGLYASSQRQGNDENTWQLPGYGRIDLMLAWRTQLDGRKLSAQLNVDNLFDKVYFDHGGYGAAAYGTPRALTATLRLDF